MPEVKTENTERRTPLEVAMGELREVWDPRLPMPTAEQVLAIATAIGTVPNIRLAFTLLSHEAGMIADALDERDAAIREGAPS